MRPSQRMLITGAALWAVLGAAVALSALPEVNADARWFVGGASILGPAAAAGAAVVLRRGAFRWAGVLLLLSAATPTYMAYALNLPALVVAVGLIVAPGGFVRPSRATRPV
jgi:hypothetical protein